MIEFTTVVSALIGAFVANFAAEFVKSHVRKNQKTESDRDAILTEIEDTILRLQEYGERFWAVDASELGNDNAVLQARIKGNQHYLSESVSALFSSNDKRECDIEIVKLLNALSGGEFDSKNRTKSLSNLTDIQLFSLKLKHIAKRNRRMMKKSVLF